MQLEKYTYSESWDRSFDTHLDSPNTLVLVFGEGTAEEYKEPLQLLSASFPTSIIAGSSTAGTIDQDELVESGLVVMVARFETATLKMAATCMESPDESYIGGAEVASDLFTSDLKSMIVLSDGLNVNGTKLTQGINSVVANNVIVTGGLAADGNRFKNTWVLVNGRVVSGYVTAVGFYGDSIQVGYGSKGGWDRLGMERKVTKAMGNVLYELDGQPALELYKRYLGDKANELPAAGLLFPLEVREKCDLREGNVRTILGIDEELQSITFAGDINEGSYATLMKANHDRLIDGAYSAAEMVELDDSGENPMLSIAISCVGRHLVLKQRTEEELDATLEVLPAKTQQVGFYSYGEISPARSGLCNLYNQTMTLTTIWEK